VISKVTGQLPLDPGPMGRVMEYSGGQMWQLPTDGAQGRTGTVDKEEHGRWLCKAQNSNVRR